MNKQKREAYAKLLEALEREGKFDEYTIPSRLDDLTPVDASYEFLPKGAQQKAFRGIVVAILAVFGPIVNFFAFGLKVNGRKKLKGIKGAVTVSNHALFLDTLVIKQTFGYARTYLTGASHNCKRGFNGLVLKCGGFLALNGTFEANKNLYAACDKLLRNGKFINFNPEQAMWVNYEKPRPHKKGAYSMAARYNVPVVPMYVLFRQTNFRKRIGLSPLVTVNILEPVYPQKELSISENARQMLLKVEEEYRQEYESFYGKRLTYLNDASSS